MASPPNPLPAFASMIWMFELGNLGRNVEHLYEFEWNALTADTLNWRRFVAHAQDLESQDNADDVACTFDLVNFTGGVIDPTWTDSDYNTAFTNIDFILTGWKAHMVARYKFDRIDAYVMEFRPEWPGSDTQLKYYPFKLTGPPEKSHVTNQQGSATGTQAGQVSFSVTEEVPVRRNWGRFYLPGASSYIVLSNGHWEPTIVTDVVNTVHAAYTNLANVELFPCVPATYSEKTRIAALNNVIAVRADDVPDVQRRRRAHRKGFTHRAPVTTTQQLPASPAGS